MPNTALGALNIVVFKKTHHPNGDNIQSKQVNRGITECLEDKTGIGQNK